MQDFAPGGSPPCPCVDFLSHPGGGLGFADALGVDGLRLCAVPCPVQAFGKSGCAFAVELPCLVHDLRKIVLHVIASLYFAGQPCYTGLDPVVGFGSVL